MSTDTEVERKWDELADRGDLRTVMQRVGQNDSLLGFAHLLNRRQNRFAIRFER